MISNNSILSVNSENHVVLSCAEPRGVPSSGVVWTKDGVEMSENVSVIYVAYCNLYVWHLFNS